MRWLVLHKCVNRFLDNWDVLKSYFVLVVAENKLQSAEIILVHLSNVNVIIKTYLSFLKYALHL